MKGRPAIIPFNGDIAPTAAPKCPKWLDKTAREKWNEFMESEDGPTFTSADELLLADLCDTFSRWRRLAALVKKTGGDVIKGKEKGKFFFNLHAAARDRAEKTMRSLAKQLEIGKRTKRKAGGSQRVPMRDRSKGPPPP